MYAKPTCAFIMRVDKARELVVMRLHENFVSFIKQTVDNMVKANGLPVISTTLTESGVAKRAHLRKLVHMGVLKVTYVTAGHGMVNAYYTKDAVPKALQNRQ